MQHVHNLGTQRRLVTTLRCDRAERHTFMDHHSECPFKQHRSGLGAEVMQFLEVARLRQGRQGVAWPYIDDGRSPSGTLSLLSGDRLSCIVWRAQGQVQTRRKVELCCAGGDPCVDPLHPSIPTLKRSPPPQWY